MKIIDSYLGRAVLTSFALTMLIMIALYAFIDLTSEMGDVGKGDYSTATAIFYILLTLPRRLYELFPSAVLIGATYGLGVLASNSELTVLRAAGISLFRVVASIMKSGGILAVIVILIGDLVAPFSEQYAQGMRSMALSGQVIQQTTAGFWLRDGSTVIHAKNMLSETELQGVRVYEFDEEHRLTLAISAKEAMIGEKSWKLKDVQQSKLSTEQVITDNFKNLVYTSKLSSEMLGIAAIKPEFLSTPGLYRYIRYLHQNGLDARRYESAFWSKLSYPFAAAVMTFLAIPFVMGSLRSVGAGQRIFFGTMVGILFHLINKTSVHVGLVYDMSPIFSAFFAPTLFFLAGLALMRKV